ncbi:Cation-transporting P-type ATPase A [Corynebacterium pseudotuberculosis]|nr:Cation-transporting P-type ATPase A [Corynebacterium pseudotuberculosis]
MFMRIGIGKPPQSLNKKHQGIETRLSIQK